MIQLRKQNCFGTTQYIDKKHKILAYKQDDKWMFTKDGKLKFSAGLVNIACGEELLNKEDEYEEGLNMVGFFKTSTGKFEFELNSKQASAEIFINSDGQFVLNMYVLKSNGIQKYIYQTSNFDKLIHYVLRLEDKLKVFSDTDHIDITAASSKDFVKKSLVRVKSSNIWAMGLDIKNRGDKTGTLYIQFKDIKGGPGDIYQYFACPIKVYNRMVGTTSKGHFFWKHIRDNLQYKKLTGDKKGKLPNAIN